ncbi:MAG: STAS domain-containing protein [Pseudomonadota bacterium]
MALTIRSTEKRPGVFILYPVGRVDSNSYSILEKKVDYLMREGQAKSLTMDMAGVDYLSSMGVRVFMKAQKELKKLGGSLSMMNLQPQIKHVFEIINALPSMQVFSSIQELDAYLDEMQKQTIADRG